MTRLSVVSKKDGKVVGSKEPLLAKDGSDVSTDDESVNGAITISTKTTSTTGCPVMDFRLPERMFSRHPGGQEHLKTAKASECPGLMFLSYHVGYDLDGIIATQAKSMGVKMPERGPFYDECHAMVQKVKAEHPEQRYIFIAWCLLITTLLPLSFAWYLTAPSVAAGIATALVFEAYFLNIFHTRHHKGEKLYGVPLLDRLTSPIYEVVDNTWGYMPEAWRRNHHVRHHINTNNEVDPDLPAMYPIIRMFPSQPKLWFHKFQTFYWPLMMPLSVARFPISNVLEHGGNPIYFLLWVTMMFVLPALVNGRDGLLCSALINVFAGYSITYKFAVSHSHEELVDWDSVQTATTDADHVDKWLVQQITESTSWGGYWSTLLCGGLNLQIEHHLAPSVDPPLLAFIAPKLRKICEKHKLKYVAEPTFFHAAAKFHARLWKLG
ncbi:unnamed protein product [Polarella glacialis]|uniref:Fatty acid desaturase domain-containing protein n=2 Tax=Polarella glacialis TaxID=89957 RepID=A0A813FIV2_POLGL|nr:unnamed protein product [Polarella glacialis]